MQKLAASSGPTVCLNLLITLCQFQKYHRRKRLVLYMHSIKEGSQQYSVTLYSEFTSYCIHSGFQIIILHAKVLGVRPQYGTLTTEITNLEEE